MFSPPPNLSHSAFNDHLHKIIYTLIIDYIARDSEHYASLFAINIVEVIELLVVSPKRGRVVPEVRKENIRETFFGSYRIIYRLRFDVVEILTIYHGSRLLDPSSLELAD